MCVYGENGFNRAIHDIENSPFRTKFEKVEKMSGTMGIGCISDSEPQPLTVFSKIGDYSISTVGGSTTKQLVNELLQSGCNQFMSMSGGKSIILSLLQLISTENDFITESDMRRKKLSSITILLMTPEEFMYKR